MILKGMFKEDDVSIIKELKGQSLERQTRLSLIVDKLIFHSFGNYGKYSFFLNILVLQKILQVVYDNELRKGILERVKQLQLELSKTKHGSKVL